MSTLTNSQKYFLFAKSQLESPDNLKPGEADRIKLSLQEKMDVFARKALSSYKQDKETVDEYQDEILKDFSKKVITYLPKYDPLRCTPETFYHRYLVETVTEYKRKAS